MPRASGRFLVRVDPDLHVALRAEAARRGLSLNELCARKLSSPAAGGDGPGPLAVRRSLGLFGEDLSGVAAFGSWARGEATEESDVDILVVVDEAVSIRRDLYRRWEAEPVICDGRRVEPHFVHLPEASARTTALWAEASLDGIVFYDPDLALSHHLARVRRRIVRGEIVQREVHGQPYWVEVA